MVKQFSPVNGITVVTDDGAPLVPLLDLDQSGGDFLAELAAHVAIARSPRVVANVAAMTALASPYLIDGQTYLTEQYTGTSGVGGNLYVYDDDGAVTEDGLWYIDHDTTGQFVAVDRTVADLDKAGLSDDDDITALLGSLNTNKLNRSLTILLPAAKLNLFSNHVNFTSIDNFVIRPKGDATITQAAASTDPTMWEIDGVRNVEIGAIKFIGKRDSANYTAESESLIFVNGTSKAEVGGTITCDAVFTNTTASGFGVSNTTEATEKFDYIKIRGAYPDSAPYINAYSCHLDMRTAVSDPDGYAFTVALYKARQAFFSKADTFEVNLQLKYGNAQWFTAGTSGTGTVHVDATKLGIDDTGSDLGDFPGGSIQLVGKIDTSLSGSRVTYSCNAVDCSPNLNWAGAAESTPGPTNYCTFKDIYAPEMNVLLYTLDDSGNNEGYGNDAIGSVFRDIVVGVQSRVIDCTSNVFNFNAQPTSPILYPNGGLVERCHILGKGLREHAINIDGGTEGLRFVDTSIAMGDIDITNASALDTSALFRNVNANGSVVTCDDFTNVLLAFENCSGIDTSAVPATSLAFIVLDGTFRYEDAGQALTTWNTKIDWAYNVNGEPIFPVRYSGSSALDASQISTISTYDLETGKGHRTFYSSATDTLGSLLWDIGADDVTIEGPATFQSGGSQVAGFLCNCTNDNNGISLRLNQKTDALELAQFPYTSTSDSYSVPGGVLDDTEYTIKYDYNPATGVANGYLNGTQRVTLTNSAYAGRGKHGIKYFDKTTDGSDETVGPIWGYFRVTPRTTSSLYPRAINPAVDDAETETVTAASPALSIYGVSKLDSSSNAIAATLGSGQYVGQRKRIVMTEASNSSTVSVTLHETSDPEVFTFNAVDEYLLLEWSGTEWVTIKATATT